MTRFYALIICCLVSIHSAVVTGAEVSVERPNIVILLADDLGWADVGYHGGVIDTPSIDRLAKEGVRLENFHATPLCSPTRAGLMTGRWPIRYGMGEAVITPWRKHGLPTTERTLADLIGREAVRYIEDSSVDEPFFLYVPFNAPHSPMQAKEEDIAKYEDRIADERTRIYAAMVDSMDQAIGKILAAIDAKGIARNTFVLFMSDNGGATSFGSVNRPWRSGKGSVYEGGVRVPAIVRWPAGGVSGGGTCDAMMGMIDVYPTVKRLAGVTVADPNPLDGLDMLDVIRGTAPPPKRYRNDQRCDTRGER